MTATVVGGSFRDPSGFVYLREGTLYRQVNTGAAKAYDALMGSGLYDTLTGRGLLVPHTEVDLGLAAGEGAYRVLEPEPVPFVSYPYEWCFSQLRAAALATLQIQGLALDHDMSLRDASAYNIQFRPDGRPVLIDTLSFEPLVPDRPWVAYRQFCQHFLAPLALISLVDVRLAQLLRVHLDGVPLDLASSLLPGRTRLRPPLLLHVHQHAKSQRRHASSPTGASGRPRQARLTLTAFRGLLESLESAVRGLRWTPAGSEWSDYYAGDSYSTGSFAHKETLVRAFLDAVRPAVVWDLGANTGHFTRLAAAAGAFTVSFEYDPLSVEASYRRMTERGEHGFLPLVQDVANPSPAVGWGLGERASLTERGPADLVMALALVHHLALAGNVPLGRIAAHLRTLAPALVIEFVPKSDPKAQLLLATREDVFSDYTREGFEQAFAEHFVIERREAVQDSDRLLYLMRGR